MHFEQAGETDKAIEYLIAAARFAYERNAVVEAFELLQPRGVTCCRRRSTTTTMEVRTRRVEIEFGRHEGGLRVP